MLLLTSLSIIKWDLALLQPILFYGALRRDSRGKFNVSYIHGVHFALKYPTIKVKKKNSPNSLL